MTTLLLSSCTCLLSQIPPQYVYVGDNCDVSLPDYTQRVTATDNCVVVSITQIPQPGYILNTTNQVVTVVVQATDAFGNISSISFTVTALDTIPPVIVADTALFSENWVSIGNIYDMADKLVAQQEIWFDATFPWDTLQIPYIDDNGDTQYIIGIPQELQPKNQYDTKQMVIWTAPRHATEGNGYRLFTFVNPGDTLIVQ